MIKTKRSDSRGTPMWLMDVFKDWFDPCPLDFNPEVDGLELEWPDKTYVNPPYSNPSPWIYKAIEENKKGKTIAMLLRFDPTTKAFKSLIEANAHILYCAERLEFVLVDPNDKPYKSPYPSILIILSGSSNINKANNSKGGELNG